METTEFIAQFSAFAQDVRAFFLARQYREVFTPILLPEAIPEAHIQPIVTQGDPSYTLAPSPEWAMKQLLAKGSGDIFQLAQACRAEEVGRWHHSNFLMLEWYRTHVSFSSLLTDIEAFIVAIGGPKTCTRWTYDHLFQTVLGIAYQEAKDYFRHLPNTPSLDDEQAIRHYVLSHCIEPHLRDIPALLITHFPACEASLSRIDPQSGRALRVECYLHGIECGNGFDELTDPKEQSARFANTTPETDLPKQFLAALANLPPCVGMAMGLERIFSVLHQHEHLCSTWNQLERKPQSCH